MKLSIIIPIYNVENYLRKCIDSVLNQDLSSDEYEIILVDDGSPDGCPQICDAYALKSQELEVKSQEYPLIRVIHRENGGLSAARNSGIEVAKGDYVMFVDSDDYIEPNVLGTLVRSMEEKQLDVLRYRLQYVNPQYEVYNPYKSDPFKGNDYSEIPTDGVSFLNTRLNTQCYAWQFIIKQSLIVKNEGMKELKSECLFTPGIYFEDTDWTPRMLCRAKRVASTETVVYNYLVREGSITNAVNSSKQRKVLDDKMHLIATLQQQAIELHKSGRYNIWYTRMIADTVISIIGILSVRFYAEKDAYLTKLQAMKIYPIENNSIKALLINISPKLMLWLLHAKNNRT